MAKMTLEGWKTANYAGWKLHSVAMLEDGRARIEFVYQMNHHAAFASFDGLEAVEARNIWDRGRVAKNLERAKAEVVRLTEELEEGA